MLFWIKKNILYIHIKRDLKSKLSFVDWYNIDIIVLKIFVIVLKYLIIILIILKLRDVDDKN